MEESYILYTEGYNKFERSLKDCFNTFNFPWKLEINESSHLPPPPPPPPPPDNQSQTINHLIEAGSYEDALKVLKKIHRKSPADEDVAKKIGKVKNWLELKAEFKEAAQNLKYETAADIIDKLTTNVPPGDGKEKLLLEQNEFKKEWQRELDGKYTQLRETKKLEKKILIIEELIEIVPAHEIEELTRQKEKYRILIENRHEREKNKNKVFLAAIIVAAIIIIVIAFYFLKMKPDAAFRKEINHAESIIDTKPEKALPLIETLQRKNDIEELKRLKEKAIYNIKIKKCDRYLREAKDYAEQKHFDKMSATLAKIREEFEGITIPQSIKKKEDQLKQKASHYYLDKARIATNPGEKFIHYHTASLNTPYDSSLLKEIKDFREQKTEPILRALLQKAGNESNCTKALKLIALCMKVKATDPRVLALRERIHLRCK